MKTPPRPEGNGKAASFFKWVHDRLAGDLNLQSSPTVRVQRTTRGTMLNVSSVSFQSHNLTPFILSADGVDTNDWVKANRAQWVAGLWEGVDAVDVYLAKPLLLRVAAKPGASHVIWPAYTDLDIVFAAQVSGGVTGVQDDTVDANEIPWLIVEEGRAWALELQICESQKAKFFCSDPIPV